MPDTKNHIKHYTVVLGITGSIAAYKSCELIRAFQKDGAHDMHVKTIMTRHATELITPATFRALTNETVATDDADEPGAPIHHISLAHEADVLVIAPATANVINKLAHGIADDLLTTTALACTAPLFIAPAMNTAMWRDSKTQESLKLLKASGAHIIEPESGYLACGDEGEGRLAEVSDIASEVIGVLDSAFDMRGIDLLVTAGATREPIDPVRFISSPASGKTGFAVANEAVARGAHVTLVSAPTDLQAPLGVDIVRVTTASEMLDASFEAFENANAAVFTAAVADLAPIHYHDSKLKKGYDLPDEGRIELELTYTPDILRTLASQKGETYVIGFAAETSDVIENAQQKLYNKNADMIVANDVSRPGLGFSSANNEAWFVTEDDVQDTGIISKRELAKLICDKIVANVTL